MLDPDEISSFFSFPSDPKGETALVTVKSKKLALPVGMPAFAYTLQNNEVVTKEFPAATNII